MNLLEDKPGCRTLLRREGHPDLDPLARPGRRRIGIGPGLDAVDEPEINEVQFDFGIKAITQRIEDVGF